MDIGKQLAPHLRDGQVVFLPPATFGSMIFAKAAHDAGKPFTHDSFVARYPDLAPDLAAVLQKHAWLAGITARGAGFSPPPLGVCGPYELIEEIACGGMGRV